eukprot:jgi/Bigna1/89533/estExt_fgenesh1_pg.C_510048
MLPWHAMKLFLLALAPVLVNSAYTYGIQNGALQTNVASTGTGGSCAGTSSGEYECEGMNKYITWTKNFGTSDFIVESTFSVSKIEATGLGFEFVTAPGVDRLGLDGDAGGPPYKFFYEGDNWGGNRVLGITSLRPNVDYTLRVVRTSVKAIKQTNLYFDEILIQKIYHLPSVRPVILILCYRPLKTSQGKISAYIDGAPIYGMQDLLLDIAITKVQWRPWRNKIKVKSLYELVADSPTSSPTRGPTQSATGPLVSCECSTPNVGMAGQNRYSCSDGTVAFCPSDEYCYATRKFPKNMLQLGCRKATQPVRYVTCNFTSSDSVTNLYLNGISNSVPPSGSFRFSTINHVENKIGFIVKAAAPAPSCAQAGFAMFCYSAGDMAWNQFATGLTAGEWLTYSSPTSTVPSADWATLFASTSNFAAPCASSKAFPLPGQPGASKAIWNPDGHQYAYFMARRAFSSLAPTATVNPTATPTTYVAPSCGIRHMGASGNTIKTTTEANECACQQECYITQGCEAWQFMTSGADAGKCYLKDNWDLFSYEFSIAGRRSHITPGTVTLSNYVFEGGYWAQVEEYKESGCPPVASKLVRKSYWRKDVCYLDPDAQKKSFKFTTAGMQFFSDELCVQPLGLLQTFTANKCVGDVHVAQKVFKMIDWSVHEVDDSTNTFLRKVFVPGYRFVGCAGPYHVEQWPKADCLIDKHNKDVWRKETCLNNIQRKRQDYRDSSCTVVKDHEPTLVSRLNRCRQEGPDHLHYWDFGCGFMHQEYVRPHARDMAFHGEMQQCVHHPHREKHCLQ